jgi:hypothetical protein
MPLAIFPAQIRNANGEDLLVGGGDEHFASPYRNAR